MRKIRILDTTLRDGEQTPGIALRAEQKLIIAKALDELGVDAIEAGFPITSKGELEGVKMIARAGLRAEIVALARTNTEDIDRVADAGVTSIHIFIASSGQHLQKKLKLTREQALEKITTSIEYAKGRGLSVEFSAEDATATEIKFLNKFFSVAIAAGAQRIDIPDTAGRLHPWQMAKIVKSVVRHAKVPVSIHAHNDYGLAVANSLAAIENGAQCAHVTVNGLGERAGNTQMEPLVMALHNMQFPSGERYFTSINTQLMKRTSELVASITGINVQPNTPIIGANAFRHESGIHTQGLLAGGELLYQPMAAASVGTEMKIQAGKHAGAAGVAQQLREHGVVTTKEQILEIMEKIKGLGDEGKQVSDGQLLSIAQEVINPVVSA